MKTTAALICPILLAIAAHAQSIWSPTPQDSFWENSANWNSGAVPADGETVTLGNTTLGAITYNKNHTYDTLAIEGGSTYIISIRGGSTLRLAGAGIINTGTADQVLLIRDYSTLAFANTANSGTATILNYEGCLLFNDHADASGSALANLGDEISTKDSAHTTFAGHSTAGNAVIRNYGAGSRLLFTGNASAGSAEINNLVRGTTVFNANSTSSTANINSTGNYSTIVFTGNSVAGKSKAAATRIFNKGTGAQTIFEGNATSFGVNISNSGGYSGTIARGNFKALAGGYFRVDSNYTSSFVHLLGQSEIASEYYIHTGGNLAGFLVGENASLTGYGRLSVGGTGNHGQNTGIITGNARITPATGTANIFSAGRHSVLTITGNALLDKGSATLNIFANNTNSTTTNSSVIIGGNATVNATSIAATGNNSSITITDNARINGSAIGTTVITANGGANNTRLTIGGHAVINNGRIEAGGGATVTIQGRADLSNARLMLRANTTLGTAARVNIAMDGVPLAINGITQSGGGEIHFTGDTDQHLVNNSNTGISNIAFSDDGIIRGSITNNGTGTLSLDRANTLRGEITALLGTIAINHEQAADTATLNLTSTGSVTFNASLPGLTLGGITGNGALNTGTRDFSVGNNSRDTAFNGSITGSGNITKIGDGTLSINNADLAAYTGHFAVDSGTLQIAGTAAAAQRVQVNNGGTLSILGTVSVNSLGIGTGALLVLCAENNTDYAKLAINDTLAATAGQIRVNITPGSTITADLAGIITSAGLGIADGDIIRTTLENAFAFTASVNAGTLDLIPTQLPFVSFAQTPNALAVANALDQISGASPVIDTLNQIHGDRLTDAFNQLSPATLATMGDLAHKQAAADLRIIDTRIEQFQHDRTRPAQNGETPWTAYLGLRRLRGSRDGNTGISGYDNESNGITIGIDRASPDNRNLYGFQIGYEDATADLDNNHGKIELNSLRLGAYFARFHDNGLWLRANAGINIHDYKTTRNLPLFGEKNTGDTDACGFTGSAEIGKAFSLGTKAAWTHAPYLRLTFDTVHISSFSESGAVPLEIKKQTPAHLVSRLAWRLSRKHLFQNGATLLASLDLGWEHESLDNSSDIGFRFKNTAAHGTITGIRSSRDSFTIGMNIHAIAKKNIYTHLGYDLDYNADYADHRLTLTAGKKF